MIKEEHVDGGSGASDPFGFNELLMDCVKKSQTLSESVIVDDDKMGDIPEECKLNEKDEESGLAEILRDARGIAADSLKKILVAVGDDRDYDFLYEVPIGLDRDSESSVNSGEVWPGVYGVFIGGESDDVLDFYDEQELNLKDELDKTKNSFAVTMAHEMVHLIQTVAVKKENVVHFETIGEKLVKGKGLEEGMAEALGVIGIKMRNNEMSLDDAAEDCEDVFGKDKVDGPTTRLSARLIRRMSRDDLKWYLTCVRDENQAWENRIEKIFGEDYEEFIQEMSKVYNAEIEAKIDEARRDEKIIEQLIDVHLV